MKKDTKFINITDAAKAYGVTRMTIHRWIKNGKIKHIVTPSGRNKIFKSQVDKFNKDIEMKENE